MLTPPSRRLGSGFSVRWQLVCGTKGYLGYGNLILDPSLMISELERSKQRVEVHRGCPSWVSFFQSVLWLENADVSNLKYLIRKWSVSVNFSSEKKAM